MILDDCGAGLCRGARSPLGARILKWPLALDVPCRTIPANEPIISIRAVRTRTSYVRRISPHNLGIMTDITPIASVADVGENTISKMLLFVAKTINHLSK